MLTARKFNVCIFIFVPTRHLHFARQQGLKDNQCIVFVNHKPGASESSRANLCKLRLEEIHFRLLLNLVQSSNIFIRIVFDMINAVYHDKPLSFIGVSGEAGLPSSGSE